MELRIELLGEKADRLSSQGDLIARNAQIQAAAFNALTAAAARGEAMAAEILATRRHALKIEQEKLMPPHMWRNLNETQEPKVEINKPNEQDNKPPQSQSQQQPPQGQDQSQSQSQAQQMEFSFHLIPPPPPLNLEGHNIVAPPIPPIPLPPLPDQPALANAPPPPAPPHPLGASHDGDHPMTHSGDVAAADRSLEPEKLLVSSKLPDNPSEFPAFSVPPHAAVDVSDPLLGQWIKQSNDDQPPPLSPDHTQPDSMQH